ncbi:MULTISPECIES: ABC transporter permease [unclassified Streptomyces]|uniref:ABC transporter permease n=1 Tax=unclassified Streptomyces TaxID=2593676 RepID=UPI001EFE0E68|nr:MULTISPECIES: ABC transporter permease [unclassified Streptomyces]
MTVKQTPGTPPSTTGATTGTATRAARARLTTTLRSPVTSSVLAGLLIGALFLLGTGSDPLTAYDAVLTGALGADGIGATLTTTTSVLGLALALAVPLRAGLINLGGDGQLVLGGITAAATALYSPLPAPLTVVLALLAGMAVGAGYAVLAALCENRFGVPLLVSSLLLSYPAVSLASYLVRYPLKEPGSSLPQTRAFPDGVSLPVFGDSTVTVGLVLVVLAAAAYWFTDRRTAFGYEIRMTGLNSRFSAYAGVERAGLTLKLMSVSGALAGLVGGIGVLSFPYRFVDGSLTAPGYTWTGLTAALLATAAPVGTVIAAFFFAVLQVGGLAMERTTEVPRELTQVLQAIVIVFLAARLRFPQRLFRKVRPSGKPGQAEKSPKAEAV